MHDARGQVFFFFHSAAVFFGYFSQRFCFSYENAATIGAISPFALGRLLMKHNIHGDRTRSQIMIQLVRSVDQQGTFTLKSINAAPALGLSINDQRHLNTPSRIVN